MRTALLALVPLLAASLAAGSPPEFLPCSTTPCTTIVIENSQARAAGIRHPNTTIDVPVGPIYRNRPALAAVSKLYILHDDSVSCTPYYGTFASGPHGVPFTFGHPSVMPGGTVRVGSILCTTGGL
ncbi:hypothetical protein F5B18DRAFT_654469 [Nemania serpens]|nr:hypothetical protein F5B18DRAFT_654469 [Nemania serpens]